MKLYYQYEQFNKDCKRIKKSKKIRSRSFVKAFLSLLYCKMSTLGTTLNDYLAASNNEVHYYETFSLQGLNGKTQMRYTYNYTGSYSIGAYESQLMGIVAGTGTNAVTSSDAALQTRIAQGTGTGQLEYSANGITTPTVAAPNASITINRILRNGSGGSITINELGIMGVCHQNIYLHVRDMISSAPIVLADGDYVKITYTMTITA